MKRPTVEVQRLLRKSTLENHVTTGSLSLPEKNHNVELFKLRASFEGFSDSAVPLVDSRHLDMEGAKLNEDSPESNGATPQDIIVELPLIDLVEIQPRDAGWFAIFTIDKKTKAGIDAFVAKGRRHFKETKHQAAYISPFSEPLQHEMRNGAYARMSVQISEYCGKLMHTVLSDEDGERVLGPGDELLDLYQKAPLGACCAEIHLMGYWYDLTKQGPLLYLTKLAAMDKTSPQAQRAKMDVDPTGLDRGGLPELHRMTSIREDAFNLSRSPSPPAPGTPGSPERTLSPMLMGTPPKKKSSSPLMKAHAPPDLTKADAPPDLTKADAPLDLDGLSLTALPETICEGDDLRPPRAMRRRRISTEQYAEQLNTLHNIVRHTLRNADKAAVTSVA